MNEYAFTVDLGKKRDYTAFMITKDNPQIVDGARILNAPDRILHYYDVVFIDQMQHRPYTYVTEAVKSIATSAELVNNHDLLVAATGVGEPVVDLMRERGLYPIPIIETGGQQVHEVYAEIGQVFSKVPGKLQGARTLQEIHVPVSDLVSAGNLLLQQGRLRVAKGLRWRDAFEQQLSDFKGEMNKRTRKVSFEADEERVHDDLVICYLLAAWWFTRQRKDKPIEETVIASGAKDKPGDWNPYDFM